MVGGDFDTPKQSVAVIYELLSMETVSSPTASEKLFNKVMNVPVVRSGSQEAL